jgi:predicted RecB family nuclease
MGSELRTGDVTTAAESITMYARYCELRADGRADEAANVLKEIEDYNRYDCRSTHKLRDWLIKLAPSNRVCHRWVRSPSPTAPPSRTPTSSPTR